MRVLLSAYEVDPAAGGEAGFGWQIGCALADRGVEVHLVTHERSSAAVAAVNAPPPGLTFHYVRPRRPRPGLRSGLRSVYANYLLWQRAGLECARRLAAEQPFDVVHHVSWASLFWGSPLWELGVPFVFGPGGGAQTSPRILAPSFGSGWRREVVRTLLIRHGMRCNRRAQRTIRRCDTFLAANRETFETVSRLGARHAELRVDVGLPRASILDVDRPFPGSDRPIVLWVGRDLPLKGVPLALATFVRVRRAIPGARLVMVGDVADSARVRDAVDAAGLDGVVEFPGYVPHDELSEWFDRSSVLLFSSLRESAGVAPFEAMARGLPVVGLDRSALRDFIAPDAAVRVALGAPESMAATLAAGVIRFCSDSAAWTAASRAAVDCARRNTWDDRADEFMAVYERLDAGRILDDSQSFAPDRRR